MTDSTGKVYIVGAGPGDIAYLTVRAKQLLEVAEVLVYDALVDTQLLHLVPANCLKLDVGKRGGQPSTQQAEINQLLVEQCHLGKQVVRLKSGDPFIFGRSSSEIQTLIAAGCPFEVVPGISSALAAPLLAGIPLTDPVLSRCVAIVSAHAPSELDWEALARIDTLVILMGGRHLGEIVYELQRHGRSHSLPVAVIRHCGSPQQQIWMGTLADILEETGESPLSPAVIVIGEVVLLREYLQSLNHKQLQVKQELKVDKLNAHKQFQVNEQMQSDSSKLPHNAQASLGDASRTQTVTPAGQGFSEGVQSSTQTKLLPLTGKTVLVTRSVGQSNQFSDLLQQQGATVIEMPALVITPPSSWEQLDRAIANLADFDWLILTSSNGVDYFFERLFAQGKYTHALASVKIAVVGKKTAQSLKEYGLEPDFVPPNFVADSLIEHFPEPLEGKKILFPRVETGGREVLVKELSTKGAKVTEVAAYESGCPEQMAPEALNALQKQTVDVITFASSKTVKHFFQLMETSLPRDCEQFPTPNSRLQSVCIASIGPQTSDTCEKLLGRVDVEAEEYTLEGLTQAIVQ